MLENVGDIGDIGDLLKTKNESRPQALRTFFMQGNNTCNFPLLGYFFSVVDTTKQ